MKLLNKTSIYYLLFAFPVFVVCSALLYYFVSARIINNLDESLVKEKITIESNLKKGESIHDLDDEIFLKEINGNISSKIYFVDTSLYDSTENEFLPYRVLVGNVSDGKKNYKINIRSSYIESDDLISSILYPVLLLFIVLLSGFFFINWFISKKMWHPFYATLDLLNQYKIDETPVKFNNVEIQEFSELNHILNSMTEKMHIAFINQKQFIENASHEIQTPLAIIKNKIELLIQSKTISEVDMHIIQSVYNANNKLSALNKALLLLSKIENHQFKDVEEISFQPLIEKVVEHFSDMISGKNIHIEKKYEAHPTYKMNFILADILITNLVQNAIRHNVRDGVITVQLLEHSLILSNTSNSSITNTNELFKRFKKNEASAESIGLGLAIVKEICDNYAIAINYTCENLIHKIELKF